MLKEMLFKQKSRSDELLPPPPPFPSLELEEEPKSVKGLRQEDSKARFAHLFEDGEDKFNPKQSSPQRISKSSIKKLQKLNQKQAKLKIKNKKGKEIATNIDDFGLDELNDFDINRTGIRKDLDFKSKPKELAEAEDEIKSAIEGMKVREKPSLFDRFFGDRAREKNNDDERLIPEIREADKIADIKNRIETTRQALMNFDLQAARENYREMMRIYNELNPQEQGKVYYEIKNIYYERKSAEGLKFR